MRHEAHLRSSVREQIENLAEQMKSWEVQPKLAKNEEELIRKNIHSFSHTTHRDQLIVAGVQGGGDFPTACYGDSYIYYTTACGTVYTVDAISKLRELEAETKPLGLVTWIHEEEAERRRRFDDAFARLAGVPVEEVIGQSDYRLLKAAASRRVNDVDVLWRDLIRPHADDVGNIAIQLRSAGEFGLALRLITQESGVGYVLAETTFSLPSISLPTGSLFYEHLKRLCCVEARRRGVGFFGLSKSHGLSAIEVVEKLAREKFSQEENQAEHWYLRIPVPNIDNWHLSLVQNRRAPSAGVVSYIVRFHRTLPVMRLDMDLEYWREWVRGGDEDETRARERRIFEDLDYTSHDQRCYGFPYPLKSSRNRATLTKARRADIRGQIVDAAVRAGMKRSLFREVARTSGGY